MPTVSSKGLLNSDLFKKIMDINVMGSVYVAKYAAPILSKNQAINDKGEKGVMLFVSSVAAQEG